MTSTPSCVARPPAEAHPRRVRAPALDYICVFWTCGPRRSATRHFPSLPRRDSDCTAQPTSPLHRPTFPCREILVIPAAHIGPSASIDLDAAPGPVPCLQAPTSPSALHVVRMEEVVCSSSCKQAANKQPTCKPSPSRADNIVTSSLNKMEDTHATNRHAGWVRRRPTPHINTVATACAANKHT